ncbi:MAG: hypothetical protein AB1896_00260 [Thermodesulfobacteriota bacterium]
MKPKNRRKPALKAVASLLGLVLAFLAAIGVLDRAAQDSFAGRRAEAYFDAALTQAAYTFAVARAVNAAVSVIQDSEVAISPAGLGVSLAVGEVVDPLDDLLEQFSWVMLVSLVSLGVQKVLLEIGIWLGLKVLLAAALAVLLVGLWAPGSFGAGLLRLGFKLFVLALVVRFGLPLVALAGQGIYDLFLQKEYAESTRQLERTKDEIKKQVAAGAEDDGSGWRDRLQNKAKALEDKAARAAEHIINLTIVFVFQTMVSPLLVLWVLGRFFKYLAGLDPFRPARPA